MHSFNALIVEDDVAQSELIRLYLEDAFGDRVSVHEALTIEAATNLIDDTDFAVIIHDLYLPPWGPEAVSQTYRKCSDVPIIVITGQTSPDLHRVAMATRCPRILQQGRSWRWQYRVDRHPGRAAAVAGR